MPCQPVRLRKTATQGSGTGLLLVRIRRDESCSSSAAIRTTRLTDGDLEKKQATPLPWTMAKQTGQATELGMYTFAVLQYRDEKPRSSRTRSKAIGI